MYYSKDRQDVFLAKYVFPHLNNGFFVEIGAANGIIASNTYYFEKEKNWQGILIEPRKKTFMALKNNRKSICINCAIAKEEEKALFLEASILSGLVREYEKKHIQMIERRFIDRESEIQVYYVQLRNFMSILSEYKINEINLLSIDTEGGELEILKSINYDKIKIEVIIAEDNYNDLKDLNSFLESKGFILLFRLLNDGIFINKSILPNVIVNIEQKWDEFLLEFGNDNNKGQRLIERTITGYQF
ncbi:MAG: FkbM family methyltransferase [Gomphosphaeria aponina SAG 52.96 = DSM 107014]|uniref:FkbM family methyltransferase n=1 Tax=Gomphosphaeria aponina SAG 52.96 = DSM 107014 TaxID=1521640 RepID=A0A941JPA4_9CHRO|nr:FkbM family methyltransferase [Gomphosphaeria aponina SAG 52.96 = DSM 107014]